MNNNHDYKQTYLVNKTPSTNENTACRNTTIHNGGFLRGISGIFDSCTSLYTHLAGAWCASKSIILYFFPLKYFKVKNFSILITCGWLGLFSILPILLVFIISLLQHSDSQLIVWHFTLANYQQLFNQLFFKILIHSVIFALITTLITLFIAYPTAFLIAQSSRKYQMILLLLLMIPFWTSSLIRTYALLAIIKVHGLLNSALLFLGIIHQPLQILYTNTAVMLGIVYNLLPFMIIPIYSNIAKLDPKLFEAARDLGASRLTTFLHIVLPLSMPGIIAGILFVFLPGMTLFYIPDLLGGAKSLLLGNLIQNQFLGMVDWPSGSATSMFLMGLMLLLLWVYRYFSKRSNVSIQL